MLAPRYVVELWSRQGVLVADISPYVKNLSYQMQRNEAEQLSFSIDLNAYEELAASVDTHPLAMLGPYQTDIKLKRRNSTTGLYEYLFGVHVGTLNASINEQESTIEVRAFGYLNLLIDRFVTKTYTATDAAAVAWDLINETQSQENGDMGFTLGADQVTSVAVDRPYVRQNVKEAVLSLSLTNGFDIEIDQDKVFSTYEMLGSDRTSDVEFLFPGNVKEISIPRDGLPLFNKIYGLGSGFGSDGLSSMQRDEDSELNYGVHEMVQTFNATTNQGELDDRTLAGLNQRKGLLEIPQIVLNGTDFNLDLLRPGDRVPVRVDEHPFLSTVNGTYRIERIEVTVDENEDEEVRAYFDNFGLSS